MHQSYTHTNSYSTTTTYVNTLPDGKREATATTIYTHDPHQIPHVKTVTTGEIWIVQRERHGQYMFLACDSVNGILSGWRVYDKQQDAGPGAIPVTASFGIVWIMPFVPSHICPYQLVSPIGSIPDEKYNELINIVTAGYPRIS